MSKLIVESNAPLVVSPDQLKLTWENTPTGLQESFVMDLVGRFDHNIKESKNELQIEHWKSYRDGILQELLGKSRRLIVSGPAQVENIKNGNGRIYPSDLWDSVLHENSSFMERLRSGYVLGELEHPESGNTRLPRVSHKVMEVWRDSGVIHNKLLIFKTPMGAIAEELFVNGVPVGQSSRGSGSTRSTTEGEIVEKSDYSLDTWDLVYQPSVNVARLSPTRESQEKKIFTPTPLEKDAAVIYQLGRGQPSQLPLVIESIQENHMAAVGALKEASDRTASARNVVESSNQYLNSGQVTLDGLLQFQTKVAESLSGLGTIHESEFATDVAQLRGSMTQISERIRTEVQRVNKPSKTTKTNTSSVTEGQQKKLVVAAADVMEELAGRAKTADPKNFVPKSAYKESIELGEALVKRARSDRSKLESMLRRERKARLVAERKANASASLLEAVVSKYRTERVAALVDAIVKKNPRLKAIESKLRECATPKQVSRLINELIRPVTEGVNQRYPADLPPINGTRRVQENRQGRRSVPAQPDGGNLMEALAKKGVL